MLLELLHLMARRAARNGTIGCVALCIVRCLEDLMKYFNRWAFCYVAIHNDSFAAAGKKVVSLFMGHGWSAIINDDLIQNCLYLGALLVAVVTALATYVVAHLFAGDAADWAFYLALIGLAAGTPFLFYDDKTDISIYLSSYLAI